MKKKKTKLFSWTVASLAALTLLCGTWASAAVSLTSGADGIYLRNSGQEYTFQVDVPKNHLWQSAWMGYILWERKLLYR